MVGQWPGGWRKRRGAPDTVADDLEVIAARTLASFPWNDDDWCEDLSRRLSDRVLAGRNIHPLLAEALRATISAVIRIEVAALRRRPKAPTTLLEAVRHRSWLRALLAMEPQVDLSLAEWLKAVTQIVQIIVNAAPPAVGPGAASSLPLTVPLIDIMTSRSVDLVSEIVQHLLRFARAEPVSIVPGAVLASRVKTALLHVSKLNEDSAAKNPHRLVSPAASGLVGAPLVEAYLSDTPFHDLLVNTKLPFQLQPRFSHQHIVATPGAGKTNLLSNLIFNDLDAVAHGRASLIVLDSQGDLIRSIVHLADFAPGGRLHDRLVYIDPTDIDFPLCLNIFGRTAKPRTALEKRTEHAALLDMLLFLFGAMRQEATGRQETMLRAVAALIQEIPDATLLTLNDIFQPADRNSAPLDKFQRYIDKLDPTLQQFFAVDFNNKTTFGQSREQIRARIQSLITDEIFRNMFSSPVQKLDIAAEMNAGKVILINAYKDLLQSGTEVFGRFFLALIAQAAQGRSNIIDEAERMPTYCYVDECHDYIKSDANVEKILDSARKYKVGMILSHQRLSQLTSALQSATSMAAIKMVRAPVQEDMGPLAAQLHTTAAFIDALPPHAFATFCSPLSHAIALEVPLSPIVKAPKMSDPEFAAVRRMMRAKYAQPLQAMQRSYLADETLPHEVHRAAGSPEHGSDAHRVKTDQDPFGAASTTVAAPQPTENDAADDILSDPVPPFKIKPGKDW